MFEPTTIPRLGAFALLIGALGTAGCASNVDLAAVQKYAETTADAESSFAALAADFQATCQRRHDAFLLLPQNLGKPDLRHAQTQLAPGYVGAAASPEPQATPAPVPSGYSDDTNCREAGAVSTEWNQHNETLLAYVHELGAIAAVDAVPSIAPAPLASPLVAANVLNATQFTAFATLATDISSFVIAGEQRASIAKLVTTTDRSVRDAVGALKTIDAAYAKELWFEYGQTEGGYEALIGQELNVRATAPPAEQFLLDDEISRQRAAERATLIALNSHRAATIDYASVLDGIETTHAQLVDAATRKLNVNDYVAIFNTTVIPLYQDVQSLKSAVR